MSIGTVKWFSAKKGYGFLTDKECGDDIFVHFSQIKIEGYKTLQTDQEVEYTVEESNRGLCAKNVVVC